MQDCYLFSDKTQQRNHEDILLSRTYRQDEIISRLAMYINSMYLEKK